MADAISSANSDNSAGGCAAGSGADVVTFSPALALPATISLPANQRIDSEVSINGPGRDMLTVDFEGSGSLSIYDDAVAIRDLTFTNAGDAIYISGSQDVTIENVEIAGSANRAFWITSGSVVVTNSLVQNNQGPYGGGFRVDAGASVTITGSQISANTATSGSGGAIFSDGGYLNVSNSTVTGNSADYDGGGIYAISGSLTLTGSTLSGNSADASSGRGGAIYASSNTVTVIQSTVENNNGSAIRMDAGEVVVTGSTFSGNLNYGVPGGGGAIWVQDGTLKINTATFSNNRSHGNGGAVYLKSEDTLTAVEIVESGFYRNTATSTGGAIAIPLGGTLTASDVVFDGNSAGFSGGAVYANFLNTASFSNATLIGNTAQRGGGLSMRGGLVTITRSTINQNTASGGNGIGTGGGANVDGTLHLSDSQVRSNSAGDGGGLTVAGEATVSNVTVTLNHATRHGGGIQAYFCDIEISDSVIHANTAAGPHTSPIVRGGGIRGLQSTISISGTTVSENQSVNEGGGIYLASSTAELASVTLTNNTMTDIAASFGGGGAIRTVTSDLSISGVTITGSNASAIHSFLGPVTVVGSTLRENTSTRAGGAIRVEYVDLNVDSSTFSINGAPSGGAIHFDGNVQDLTVQNSSFIGNTAHTSNGGAIESLITTDGIATLGNITAYDNSAAVGGGAIHLFGVGAYVSEVTLATNTAGEYGGGLAISSADTLDISQSAIFDNRAGLEGGGVFSYQTSIEITASTVSQNAAPMGAGISANGSDLTVTDSTVVNRADATASGMGVEDLVATISNSIVVGGSADCYLGADASAVLIGENHFSDASCGGQPSGDPLVTGVADNGGPTPSQYPRQGSPVIDAGGTGCDGQEDQRGVVRAAPCDIGSVETVGANDPPVLVPQDFTVFGQPMNGQLIGALDFFDPDGVLPVGAARILDPDAPFALDDAGSLTIDTPDPEFGIYEFSIEVTDAEGLSDRARISVALDTILFSTGFEVE